MDHWLAQLFISNKLYYNSFWKARNCPRMKFENSIPISIQVAETSPETRRLPPSLGNFPQVSEDDPETQRLAPRLGDCP